MAMGKAIETNKGGSGILNDISRHPDTEIPQMGRCTSGEKNCRCCPNGDCLDHKGHKVYNKKRRW